jgi:hypothetical protein
MKTSRVRFTVLRLRVEVNSGTKHQKVYPTERMKTSSKYLCDEEKNEID